MKKIIHNSHNLKEEDITEIVIRTKALIIERDSILICKADNVYQFPGGHLESGETFIDCLKREVKEETGIELEDKEIKNPFMKVTFLSKDHPFKGNNRQSDIYYYIIKTNKKVNLENTNYTSDELSYDFKVERIKLNEVIKKIKENMQNNPKNEVISPDMIEAIKEYIRISKEK